MQTKIKHGNSYHLENIKYAINAITPTIMPREENKYIKKYNKLYEIF
jgi:hypothetical protein